MPTTSNYALRYPSSTDDVRPYEDIQFLATDVDAALTRKGYIADNQRTTSSGTITTTETVVQSLTFTAVAGIRYKVVAEQSVQGDAAGGSAVLRLRWATGASVTSSGTQIDSKIAPFNTANLGFLASLRGTFVPGVNGQVTVGVTVVRNNGAANIISFGSAAMINTILVEGV